VHAQGSDKGDLVGRNPLNGSTTIVLRDRNTV
jgi:hypothetical protein